MAISKTGYNVKWSTANSQSVAAAGNATSDERAIADNAIAGVLRVKASNNGTAASGDIGTAKILYNGGDPDADPDSADEFGTVEHAAPWELDTYLESGGVVQVDIPIDVTMYGFKLYVENGAASNGITFSAEYIEQTA